MKKHTIRITMIAVFLLLPATSFAGQNFLRPPFDLMRLHESTNTEPAGLFVCEKPPAPVTDIYTNSIYKDGQKSASTVDQKKLKQYKADVKPINQFENSLTRMANAYVNSNPPDSRIALCAVGWLAKWAKDDALLGGMNKTGRFVRKGTLATISSSYVQFSGDPEINSNDRHLIEGWLRAVAEEVITDFSRDEDLSSQKNNHLYWAAWSLTIAGVALQDREFFDWGVEKARVGLDQIRSDGVLPLEAMRGNRALLYHLFATTPLVMVAEAGKHNGIDLYSYNGYALKRLVDLDLSSLDDSSYLSTVTGVDQNLEASAIEENIAWLEIWNARFPDKRAEKWLKKFRPLVFRKVGGDTTMLYGTKKIARK